MNNIHETVRGLPKRLGNNAKDFVAGHFSMKDPKMDSLIDKYWSTVGRIANTDSQEAMRRELCLLESKLRTARPSWLEVVPEIVTGVAGGALTVEKLVELWAYINLGWAHNNMDRYSSDAMQAVMQTAGFSLLGIGLFTLGFIVGPAVHGVRNRLARNSVLEDLEGMKTDISSSINPNEIIQLGIATRSVRRGS